MTMHKGGHNDFPSQIVKRPDPPRAMQAVDKRTTIKIGLIRARNNDLWMKLLDIALETAPNETKEVLRQINENDRKISDLLGELAK